MNRKTEQLYLATANTIIMSKDIQYSPWIPSVLIWWLCELVEVFREARQLASGGDDHYDGDDYDGD